MYQLKPTTAAAVAPPQQQAAANTLVVTQTNGVVSIRLPDGTRISFQKDGLAFNAQMPAVETAPLPTSNPADLQKIAELSAALAASKMDIAKLSQEMAVLQREKKAANDELAVLKSSSNKPVYGYKPAAVETKPNAFPLRPTSITAAAVVPPPPVVDPTDEITKAADVTEEKLIKHIAGKFDVNKMVSSDSPQNSKYGASPLLFWAAYGGHARSIDLLLKAGARRDLKGPSNETPLEVCIRKQRSEECIQLLKPPVLVVVPAPAPSFIRQPAPTAPPNYTRPVSTNASPSFYKQTPVVGVVTAAPASPVTPITSTTPATLVAVAAAPVSPVIPTTTVAAPTSPSVSFAATIVEETAIPANPVPAATEPAAGDPAPVAAPETAAPALDPNRPLTFLEKRRLSASKPPIITGALDVSALRSGLRPAPPKVVPPPKEPSPPPAPVATTADGAPPVRINKLADRMKMFERKG